MLYNKSTYNLLAALIIAFMLTGCGGDSSTGPDDHGKPPTSPNLEKAEPDISFFKNNSPQKAKADASAFNSARSGVTTGAFFTGIGTIYGTLFDQSDQEGAEFNDGEWTWSYSYNSNGVSGEYRRTAKELSDGSTEWALFFSYDDGDTHIDNYKIIGGTVSEDGSHGDWTFNVNNPDNNQETPALKSEWDYNGDSNGTIALKIYEDGNVTNTINYEQSANDYTMSINADGKTINIGWNTQTNVGYYQDSSGKTCWDGTFYNAPCSDVGF